MGAMTKWPAAPTAAERFPEPPPPPAHILERLRDIRFLMFHGGATQEELQEIDSLRVMLSDLHDKAEALIDMKQREYMILTFDRDFNAIDAECRIVEDNQKELEAEAAQLNDAHVNQSELVVRWRATLAAAEAPLNTRHAKPEETAARETKIAAVGSELRIHTLQLQEIERQIRDNVEASKRAAEKYKKLKDRLDAVAFNRNAYLQKIQQKQL
jgi:chromosome segregation ATPase